MSWPSSSVTSRRIIGVCASEANGAFLIEGRSDWPIWLAAAAPGAAHSSFTSQQGDDIHVRPHQYLLPAVSIDGAVRLQEGAVFVLQDAAPKEEMILGETAIVFDGTCELQTDAHGKGLLPKEFVERVTGMAQEAWGRLCPRAATPPPQQQGASAGDQLSVPGSEGAANTHEPCSTGGAAPGGSRRRPPAPRASGSHTTAAAALPHVSSGSRAQVRQLEASNAALSKRVEALAAALRTAQAAQRRAEAAAAQAAADRDEIRRQRNALTDWYFQGLQMRAEHRRFDESADAFLLAAGRLDGARGDDDIIGDHLRAAREGAGAAGPGGGGGFHPAGGPPLAAPRRQRPSAAAGGHHGKRSKRAGGQ